MLVHIIIRYFMVILIALNVWVTSIITNQSIENEEKVDTSKTVNDPNKNDESYSLLQPNTLNYFIPSFILHL